MSAFRKSGGRNAQLVLAAISIILILMMGPFQVVHASGFSGAAYTALFYRTGCEDLSTPIQARFEWDISGGTNNTNTMTIKDVGTQGLTKNLVFGAFKFNEFALGDNYNVNANPYYPGIEAFANFRNYSIFAVNMTETEPSNGLGAATVSNYISMAVTYSANFSTAKDQFRISITQTSTDVVAYYYIISSSGTVLHTWSLDQPLSSVTLKPPYHHYVVSDELDGLEVEGYASVHSGTDFQIESVIHPSTATDFIGYQTLTYHGSTTSPFNEFTLSSCSLTSWVDEEGDNATYTYDNYWHNTASNEAYQYVTVT
jgi:hypothetical protein